jgi:hypothetical protein
VSSVRIIRNIVGAGAETKVMVSADEVTLAPKAGSEYSTSKVLRTLAGVMDSDRKGKNIFHMCASVVDRPRLRRCWRALPATLRAPLRFPLA